MQLEGMLWSRVNCRTRWLLFDLTATEMTMKEEVLQFSRFRAKGKSHIHNDIMYLFLSGPHSEDTFQPFLLYPLNLSRPPNPRKTLPCEPQILPAGVVGHGLP